MPKINKTPSAFVAMPIRQEGTPEHGHFLAIYRQGIKPVLDSLGFQTLRADEIQKTGAITKEIIVLLGEADLVISDLTDLNPNVFYELGVRHALRSKGTIMLQDVQRTEDIPFDLSAYRVIRYKGDLTGLADLAKRLEGFIREVREEAFEGPDNPVHDWLPSLPADALASSKGTTEGELRERISHLHSVIARYKQVYGEDGRLSLDTGRSPIDVIANAISEADEGNLPPDLMRKADSARAERDAKAFLLVVRRVVERGIRLGGSYLVQLAAGAQSLGLDEVAGALYDHAASMYPNDGDVRSSRLAHMAHSDDPSDRARARVEIGREIGVSVEDGKVHVPSAITRETALLLGVMLDSYHKDRLGDQALEICKALFDKSPDNTIVVRNYARALKVAGESDLALEYFKKAIACSDADDASALWLGTELHNRRRYLDAVEAYLSACLIDPNDSSNFSNVADDLSWALAKAMGLTHGFDQRVVPAGVNEETVATAIQAALSCPIMGQQDVERCSNAAKRIDLQLAPEVEHRVGLRERIEFARRLYEKFATDLTGTTSLPMLASGPSSADLQDTQMRDSASLERLSEMS